MLTIFTWGYYGWGSTTTQLVQAVDAAESARGFNPPVFYDIRIRRNVRAKGFSGQAFARTLPAGRYIWEKRLGNAAVAAHESGIRIADPSAAKGLLEDAICLGKHSKRIIFFCSCEFSLDCHRNTVADLVLKEANKIGRKIEIVEWPGGTPVSITFKVAPEILKAVARGRKSVPLGKNVEPGRMTCLPWASTVLLQSDQQTLPILTGPAKYQNEWVLPVLECGTLGDGSASLAAASSRLRRERGWEPSQS